MKFIYRINKYLIGFLIAILFNSVIVYIYLIPIYSMTLNVPENINISFEHVGMIIDASKQCRRATYTSLQNNKIQIFLKTNNLDFGSACIDYVSSRIVCETTFEFPYDKCEIYGVNINQLSNEIQSQGLVVLEIEKNNKFRYFLFYILGITFIFCIIYFPDKHS